MRIMIKALGYAGHHRLFHWPAAGREVLVDPTLEKDEGDYLNGRVKLTKQSYDYVKEAAGKSLLIEPLDAPTGAAAAAKISDLEDQLAAAQARVDGLEKHNETLRGAVQARDAEIVELKAQARMRAALDGEESRPPKAKSPKA